MNTKLLSNLFYECCMQKISFDHFMEQLEEIIDHKDERFTHYAEIDYGDREDAEAYSGQRFDDMNF